MDARFSQVPTVHSCIIILEGRHKPNASVKVRKQVMIQDALRQPYDYEIPQNKLGMNTNCVFDIFFDPTRIKFVD